MARINPDTKIKARIRRYIKQAIDWNKVDDGMPYFYDQPPEKYTYAKRIKGEIHLSQHYYTKSTQAIKEIAEKIFKLCK